MDLERIDASVLIKTKKAYPGSSGQLVAIPSDYVKLFGPIDEYTMLLGNYLVVIPNRGDGKKKKKPISLETYEKVMNSLEKILGD